MHCLVKCVDEPEKKLYMILCHYECAHVLNFLVDSDPELPPGD